MTPQPRPSRLEFNKLVVQPVVIERDADDRIIGERIFDPVPVHTEEQAIALFASLREGIEQENLELAMLPQITVGFEAEADPS